MAKMMDDMEQMGVLAKPENIGIIPKNVHTSYLVPKTDGRYRFVTDFTNLLPFIGKLEVVTPSISNAKRVLSSFKYLAELDLSHCFWQGCMSPEDSQYLATPHPFGGLRVYCREPQGIRNASEHNSERLARIFGDMEMNQQMCRMADGLYVGGKTLDELFQNLSTVFERARLSGLTFKPSKVVICPQETVIFGWKKSGNKWSPTNHVVSPLSQAPLPKTIKQLRGFIGAYRQLSDTIKDHAITLGALEKLTGGKNSREHVSWTDDLRKEFELAKQSLTNIKSIAIPKPTDFLNIYPDFSETANAVGSHLIIFNQEDNTKLNGGYFSIRLEDCQTRWTPCEKECLGIKLSIEHFKSFIQNSVHKTVIHTDNLICVQAWNRLKQGKISSSSRVASFLSSLSENNIEIVHYPGSKTKVADFSSRNPLPCQQKRCQICSFAFEQTTIGDLSTVMSVTVQDLESGVYRIPLSEKPTWLRLQKRDDTHQRLYKLITSGGLQPEPKLRGHSDLKRLYNLYRRGLLSIDNLGLITVKHIDVHSGFEYDAISVPTNMFPSLIQSLHIKLNHPSRNQLHKFVNRHFFCIGVVNTIDSVHQSCEICASLSTLPKTSQSQSTTSNPIFGQNFSADVLVSDGQKIFICREKLSQYVFTKFIEDETADTIREAIVEAVSPIMPSSGASIRLDPAPAHKALSNLQKDTILRKFGITLDLGRPHNPNKNPVAENGIKEFRKERLRLNKHGGPLTELDRITITNNMNQRIRNRGLASKEIYHRRTLTDNKPCDIVDKDLSDQQYNNRTSSHKNPETQPKIHPFNLGDRVFIKSDLNKLRGREEYMIMDLFLQQNEPWARLRKSEKSFRNETYDVKQSEIIPASRSFSNSKPTNQDVNVTDQPFHGFSPSEVPTKNAFLDQQVAELSLAIPSSKGRRPNLKYPDYVNRYDDLSVSQPFYGFPSQSRLLREKADPPAHSWDQSQWFKMLNDEMFDYFPQMSDIDALLLPSPPHLPNHDSSLDENLPDFWEDHNDFSEPTLQSSIASVVNSIESNDLTMIDPQWESPASLLRKNNAAKKIQRAWRSCSSSAQTIRHRSSTDPYFLVKIPIVSDEESEISDDAFYSPPQSRSATPTLAHFSQPVASNTVYNVERALSSMQIPQNLDQVQDVSLPLDLLNSAPQPRPSRNIPSVDYKLFHSKGHEK